MAKYLQLPKYRHYLGDRKLLLLVGSDTKKRDDVIYRMKHTKEKFFVLATFAIGGTGHNFQQFTRVVFIDCNWNPQVNAITSICF